METTALPVPAPAAAARARGQMAHRGPLTPGRRRGARIGVRVAGLALVLLALAGPYLLGSGRTSAAASGPAAPAGAGLTVPVAPDDQARTASPGMPLGGGAPRLDYADVALKAGLVIVLLVVTLRLMRRFGAGPRDGTAQLTVLESRGVGPKSQVMLLAVGDRRLVVGVTPGGMTTLADLSAATLAATEPASTGAAMAAAPAGATARAGLSAMAAALRDAVPFRRGVRA